MKTLFRTFSFFAVILLLAGLCSPLAADNGQQTVLSAGQTVYVPAYSHIYSGNKERPFLLTVTLSIRNIDLARSIEITAADYYETQGHLLKKHIDKPVTLAPLESVRYIIPEKDESGGSGANFIVKWQADRPVNPPVVECVMIGTQAQQGISFASRGQVVLPGAKQ